MPDPTRVAPAIGRTLVVDLALALVATAAMVTVSPQLDVTAGVHAVDAVGNATIVVAGAGLALRRVAPLMTLLLAAGTAIVYTVTGQAGGPIYLVPLVGVYAVASARSGRTTWWATLATLGAFAALAITSGRADHLVQFLLFASWLVAAHLVGRAVWTQRRQASAERAHLVERAQQREDESRRKVAEERLRIARDVHDTVAHHLASIVMQAGVGAHVIDRSTEQAGTALVEIRDVGRTALNELRDTLALIREGGDTEPASADLAALVRGFEHHGLDVRLDMSGELSAQPAELRAATYRIVQEALTNTLRHAAASRVHVAVVSHHGGIDVEVRDNGHGWRAGHQIGHGLVGMRERAEGLAGTLSAEDGPAGGFVVRATLPVPS